MRIEINTRAFIVRVCNDAVFESRHPRDKDGKFIHGGGSDATGKIAYYTDFAGMPPKIVNVVTNAIARNIEKYPFMTDFFSFIGSTNARLARELGDSISPDNNTTAMFIPEFNARKGRISISPLDMALVGIRPDSSNYHPVGCNTHKAVADHEFGHALWYRLGLHKPKAATTPIKAYIRQSKAEYSHEDITRNLSAYANTDDAEFFAEAFSELQNNPNPRPLAKKVGELLDAEIKAQKLDKNNERK